MDISESTVGADGECRYRTLYRYNISSIEYDDNNYKIERYFENVNKILENLQARLVQFGVPENVAIRFL